MSSSPDTGSVNLWDQTWAKVNAVLGGGSKMQLIYPSVDWTWPLPNPGYTNATANSVVDQVPNWSAVGKSISVSSLYASYKILINKCPKLTITPELEMHLKQANEKLDAAHTTLTGDTGAKNRNWIEAQKVPSGILPPKYDEWLVSSGWKARLNADSQAVQKAVNTKVEIVQQQNAYYAPAIKKAAMPTDPHATKPGFLKCNVNGKDEWCPGFILNQGQDWVAQLTQGGGSHLTIQMDASKAAHAMKESWAGGATGYGSSFFSIYANGSWHDMNLTESNLEVQVEINIKAVTQVPVRAGEWYDGEYLSYLATCNRWNSPFTTQGGESPVFGKGGILPLTISYMIAGYQVSFSISMSSSTFDKYVSDFKACEGIRIGPFHVGGGYNTQSDTWTKETSGMTFKGESKATYPFIFGFIVAEPGLGELVLHPPQ